jgi:hypothetical protein
LEGLHRLGDLGGLLLGIAERGSPNAMSTPVCPTVTAILNLGSGVEYRSSDSAITTANAVARGRIRAHFSLLIHIATRTLARQTHAPTRKMLP